MEWYLPITVLPAVGLLVAPTSSQMMALSAEIGTLLSEKCTPFERRISDMKIEQLGRLTKTNAPLYSSAASFVTSGLVSATVQDGMLSAGSQYVRIAGVAMVLGALLPPTVYGFRAITIRKLQHRPNHER